MDIRNEIIRGLKFKNDVAVRQVSKQEIQDIIKKELTIRGGFIGRFSFSRVARLLESGELPLDVVVTHRIPLADVHKGIELLKKQLALKIIVEP